ncbi:molybdate ABC transporter permease subunit [Chitiniphilus eburneus]|uniref:Molybdenum transport system permease n=1 Tax=Chitiniphilus eburneus TaxID=2571148 RepID=A0A4U0PDG7_9NEIS|nr:molybdate ABC transporter permease subunit [Chitiniphilus eburneus]TJZ65639.1 molybdate ABC transporter permease subunit [Chitiniphilus eburneus]
MTLDLAPLWLTARLAATTTVILLILGVPLAAWIAHSRSRLRPLVETLVAMPLVLPPSVLGFYLLWAFSPGNAVGAWLENVLGVRLVFSFAGLVVGSVLFSLPFMVQPIRAALAGLPANLIDVSLTLGKSRFHTLLHVELPCVKPALVAGTVMAFAHTVGEFGLVLMLGGNIPGVTRVASIAIYTEVEALNYPAAHAYAAILCGFAFAVVFAVHWLQRRAVRA